MLEAGSGEDFGHEGLLDCLNRSGRLSAADLADRILSEAANQGAIDDTTAVVLTLQP